MPVRGIVGLLGRSTDAGTRFLLGAACFCACPARPYNLFTFFLEVLYAL